MSERRRRAALFACGILPFGFLVGFALLGLPGFGFYPGPYGDRLNAAGVAQRHLTNLVSAVNFDYRGLDTLGEEYILFAAVTGASLLLRGAERQEAPKGVPPRRQSDQQDDDAVRLLSAGLAATLVLFGIYVVLHAHLTPGGGFQGGAIIGTASALLYLSYERDAYHRLVSKPWVDLAEAIGAGSYAVIGLGALAAGGAFLQNVLPLGTTGQLLSAGTIPVINAAVGLEVSAGFALLFLEFTKGLRPSPGDKGSLPQP